MGLLGAISSVDWLVLLGYFLLLGVSGWWLSRRKVGDTRDYFLGGRSIPMWAAAISFLATAQSAATFLGGPQIAFGGDWTYLSVSIGQIVAAILVACFFVPAFYRHNVTTVYELLERRIGGRAKRAASGMFMVGRVFASGARLFMASLAVSMILFSDIAIAHVSLAIAVMVVIGIFYTLVGGVRSVIFTDVIQAVVYVGAAIAAIGVLWWRLPMDTPTIIDMLAKPTPGLSGVENKLTILDTDFGGFGSEHTFTLWTVLTGWMLLNLAAFGTDQDLAQRTLTCTSARRAGGSVIVAMLVGVPVTMLFLMVGSLLYVHHVVQAGDATSPIVTGDTRKVFLAYIMDDMPIGLTGLMLAGLIAAGLSSFNSALHAMASAFVSDVYRNAQPARDERHYVRVGRLAVIAGGVLLGAFACLRAAWQKAEDSTLLAFALKVMTFAYSGLLAVFLTALFTRRGSNASVIAALVVGFVVVLIFQQPIWERIAPQPWRDFTLAAPWQMVLATALAFVVCVMGKPVPQCKDQPIGVTVGTPPARPTTHPVG